MTTMNRENRRAMDVLIKKRQSNVIDSLDDETLKMWERAKETKGWIHGEPIKLPNGDKVDFAMMDFIIAQSNFLGCTSMLEYFQRFWAELQPYTDNMINNMQFYISKFREIEEIETEVLKKYADQNLELQYRQIFMKEHMDKDIEREFQEFLEKKRAESDAEIAKIREREEKFQEKEMEKEAKRKEVSRLKEFANKLKR